MSQFRTVIKDLEEYLDWNRFMLLGLIFWALFVALVVDNNNAVAVCSGENPFLGVIWIVGLILLATTCLAECLTDVRSKNDKHKRMIWYPFLRPSKPRRISWKSIWLRLISNLFVFYTIVAISSYSWFPVGDDATCFVPWTQRSKDWSLGIIGIITVILLIVRVMLFDYITIEAPKSEALYTAAAITASLEVWRGREAVRRGELEHFNEASAVLSAKQAALSALRAVDEAVAAAIAEAVAEADGNTQGRELASGSGST